MRRIVIAIGLAALSSASPEATVVIPATLTELVRDASSVAVGTVVATEVRWTESRRAVETIVTLSAQRYLKGGLGETVRFRVPGGRLGRYRTIMLGAPEFRVGQRVIVFLGGRSSEAPHVLGLSQGVFRLVPTDAGWVVTPAGPYTVSASATRIVRGDPSRRPMPLAEFEREVRVLVGAGQ
jgi:hypothetical protein